jgi:reversibly glycosylated polypeptide
MLVVIPTSRAVSLEYLEPLIDFGARFIIVDDSEGKVRVDHPQFSVFTWQDQARMLGKDVIAIPRRNGACRDFGFYIAWRESAGDEIVIALDDDCKVEQPDFGQSVQAVLSDTPRPVAAGEGRHFNILDCYRDIEKNVFPRGFPYSQRAHYREWSFDGASKGAVVFNLGLWREYFDVNAIDKLQGPQFCYPDAELQHDSVIVPNASLISVCSMNMQFRREVIPAVYQLPMHVEVMPGWVIDRYGDIWGGFMLKTLMDLRGDRMAAGGPMIRHLKEGSYQRNIWQEHICHLVNDEFLSILDKARDEIKPSDYLTMTAHLAEVFDRERENSGALLRHYLDVAVPAMKAWTRVLSVTAS